MVRPAKKRGIYIGAKVLLPLPENGGLGIVQADPNTLAREAMKDKWEKMKEMGARLLKKVPQLKRLLLNLTVMMPCSIPFFHFVL
ncbi:hypothetical protein J966_3882 [Acinetobacter baumannii 44839_10]|nr:hypothetical protein J966_3882 [Acinetobacter baumannii 44839_10]